NLTGDQISSSSAEQQGRTGEPETRRNEAARPLREESRRVFERQRIRKEIVRREGEGDAAYEHVYQNEEGLPHARHLTGTTDRHAPSHHRLTNDSLPVGRIATTYVAEIDLRSEEHTSELQSRENLVCRLLLEKKKKILYRSTKILCY